MFDFFSQIKVLFPQVANTLEKVSVDYGVIERVITPDLVGQKETFELDEDSMYCFIKSELIIEDETDTGSIDQVPDLFLHPQGELQRMALIPTLAVDKSQWVYKSQQILIHGEDLEHYLQVVGSFTKATYRFHYIRVEINV